LLVITDLFGNTEALIDIQDAELLEEVNGDFSISFTCFLTERNLHSFPLVQEESVVEWEGQEFRIKKIIETRNRKEVFAQHIFFETIDNHIYTINGGTLNLNNAVAFALNGTGWTFSNVDVTESKLLPDFGEDNSLSLIRKICNEFQCEVKVEPNRHLEFKKEVGTDNDFQFRYKHNVKTLKRTVDTANLTTVIRGYGAEGLEVEYRSPNAAIYGDRHGEPVQDDRFTIAESLLERCKEVIRDVPEVSIELDVTQLGFGARLGDKVWLIYEPLKIEFQTRVLAIKSYLFTNLSPVVVLSNLKRTFTDLLTQTTIEVKENKKETRSKIEQTNESITLAVERIGEAEAQIEVQAEQITSKVSQTDYNGNTIASLFNQTATTILLQAEKIDLDGIVRVNKTLYIGSESEYDTKTLWFNNAANLSATGYGYGGVSEMKFGTSNLNFEFVDDVFFRNTGITTRINGNLDFQYANVSNLYVTVVFG
jgi:phage minor structural protein